MVKVIIFDAILSALGILIFSKAFIGLNLNGSPLEAAFGYTAIFCGAASFLYVNLNYFFKNPKKKYVLEINSLNDCKEAVETYIEGPSKTFLAELRSILAQISKFSKKKKAAAGVFKERFENSISFEKFNSSLENAEKLIIGNVRGAMSRLSVFDEDDYAQYKNRPINKLTDSRVKIFEEVKYFVNKTLENNEEILFALDRLVLEISKLDEAGDLDLSEIETLIGNAKLYK
jgi:hypothetical protein